MTTDEVKAWLRSYRWLQAEIDRTEEEIEQWRARAERLTQSFSGMPPGSGSSDQIPNAVEKIAELEEQLQHKVTELVQTRKDIEAAIEQLPDKQQRILRYRYIDQLTWEMVAVKVHYDYRWVIRIHGHALQQLSNLTIERHI